MYTKWTSHLPTEEAKTKFKDSVVAAKPVLQRQIEIIDENLKELDRAEINPKNYEVPNWDYRQAHNNGYRQALVYLRRLIDLDNQKILLPGD